MLQIMFSGHNGTKLDISNKENWKIYKYVEIKWHTLK